MSGMSIPRLAQAIAATAVHCEGLERRSLGDVSTDTRSLRRGNAFIALRGPSFDGHDFVGAAFERGAMLCIVQQSWYRKQRRLFPDRPFLVVADTVRALGDAAREQHRLFPVPVLLVTGSNGKTTTKGMIATILESRYRVLTTHGNFNNHIGLPLTLLRLRASHDIAVLEAGTNRPGDIPWLASVAEHTHALITNIGHSHLQGLGSREGVAAEKGAALRLLPPGGVAFLPRREPLLRGLLPRGRSRRTFGFEAGADVRVIDIRLDRRGCPSFRFEAPRYRSTPFAVALRVPGRHAALNAAAAAAVGLEFGCTSRAVAEALGAFASVEQRMTVESVAGITVINDSYNANPDSVAAALDTLAAMDCDGARIAVLGDMLELGSAAPALHRMVGERAAAAGIPYVVTHGRLSRHTAAAAAAGGCVAVHCAEKPALHDAVAALAQEGDLVLVKGSRGMAMDDVIDALDDAPADAPADALDDAPADAPARRHDQEER